MQRRLYHMTVKTSEIDGIPILYLVVLLMQKLVVTFENS